MILHCDYCNSDMPETENWKCPNCGATMKIPDNSIKLYPNNLAKEGIMELEVVDGKLYAKKNGEIYKWNLRTCEWRKFR